jgi:hypothetical protein
MLEAVLNREIPNNERIEAQRLAFINIKAIGYNEKTQQFPIQGKTSIQMNDEKFNFCLAILSASMEEQMAYEKNKIKPTMTGLHA